MSPRERAEAIAKDLYEACGRCITVTELAKFLDDRKKYGKRDAARRIVNGLTPAVGKGKRTEYYFRDVADAIAAGDGA